MAAITDIGTLITQTPGVQGGRPCIAGTRVTVRRIVVDYHAGLVPEEIQASIPHLTMAQVLAALTFYHANREMMDTQIAEEKALYDQLATESLRSKTRKQEKTERTES